MELTSPVYIIHINARALGTDTTGGLLMLRTAIALAVAWCGRVVAGSRIAAYNGFGEEGGTSFAIDVTPTRR